MGSVNNSKNKNSHQPLVVFEYEVRMYFGTQIPLQVVNHVPIVNPPATIITNALVESRILHTRQIVDILISKSNKDDDIRLEDILPNIDIQPEIELLIKELKDIYGTNTKVNSPCWTINKMLAHPTKHRTNSFNYGQTLNQIDPTIKKILKLLSIRTRRPSLFPFTS